MYIIIIYLYVYMVYIWRSADDRNICIYTRCFPVAFAQLCSIKAIELN